MENVFIVSEQAIIRKEAYDQMKDGFDEFSKEIRELCQAKQGLENWLDNQQVCLLLRISKRTLQYYRERGLLPFSLIGHKCFYKKADVELLIKKSIISKK